MNIYEAKKFLNNNGYLLEDRFGGGKDRYGHKIKRLKLSDLDNEDGEEPVEFQVGDVEPTDFTETPTEAPIGQPVGNEDNVDLLELTYTTLEDVNFPGYIDYDENGLTLVIHDLLQSNRDFLNRASKVFGDIEETTNEKYEESIVFLSYYLDKDKKNMETKIKGFLIDFIDFVKFELRESNCDNILSVDVELDYEKLYNSCGEVEAYVEQLKEFNSKCDLVRQYLANWIEVNLGTK